MTIRVCATAALPSDSSGEERAGVASALSGLAASGVGLSRSHACIHLEGALGAGDLTWDFSVDDASVLVDLEERLAKGGWSSLFEEADSSERGQLAKLSQIEAWRVEPQDSQVPRPDLVGIKRTNLVRVLEKANEAAIEQWRRDVIAMPSQVPAIRNWSLARVYALGPTPPRVCWTHAWEQEFETLEGLVMDYMMSPYHWGWLDGWYDPEMPHAIIDPDLAHLYGAVSQNVLGWTKR